MAGQKGVKKREHENLTAANIEKVIALLEATPPITKKEACEILSISYNTTRLSKIIAEHKDGLAEAAKRKAANRGKPANEFEIQSIIEGQLDGESVASMAERLFRPTSFVKRVVEETVGLPEKGDSYFNPPLLPEPCVAEKFRFGELVWSSRYNTLGIITHHFPPKSEGNSRTYDMYEIWVIETMEEIKPEERYFPNIDTYGGFFASQAVYDLGSMEHLRKFGIDIYKPYRKHFTKWLNGDFSGKFGEKRWAEMLANGVEVYGS